jgi:5,5'-dehydrodivanillate O-demethylase
MPSPELDAHGQPQFQYLNNDVDPQDNAIFISQGALHDRTKELLGESDHGVVLYRHLLENQIKLIAAGKDPLNTFRDPAKNIRIDLATESRDKFLTGRMGTQGMRRRYSERFKALDERDKRLP